MTAPTRTCEHCSTEFQCHDTREGRGKFCSKECQKAAQREVLVCPGCGEKFSVRASRADSRKYCSAECNPECNATPTDCPSCDRTFSTPGGMKVHHAAAHGEKLGQVELICANCGEAFQTRRDRADTREYCSAVCQQEHHTTTIECEWCSNEFRVKSTHASRRAHCSRDCYTATQRATWQGDGHPRWNGGYRSAYGEGWEERRLAILERDNHRCQLCGLSNQRCLAVEGQELSVHHMTPYSEADPETANEPGNLLTVCNLCHQRVF